MLIRTVSTKVPSERVSGLARYQVSHTVCQNGPQQEKKPNWPRKQAFQTPQPP
ncbi:hypothetical protein M405DRAFT_811158 [Rhizopogon salebrosus TDB-379]|nr:hypothetical protein M405DRAFT_811158 [Rhizopogon salebrosus TDB-379]